MLNALDVEGILSMGCERFMTVGRHLMLPWGVLRPMDGFVSLALTKQIIGKHMNLVITPHNLSLTEALESHIRGRIEKLEHIDPRAISAQVIIEHDKTIAPENAFKCSMRLAVAGPDLYAEDHESDMYAAIDLVTKKIEQQIRKRHNKEKAKNHALGARAKQELQDANL